uniref:Uncharacterized protein n=1 Tax=Oryzias latipes TaxID=8090 RepID=A0A3P9MGV4_ORYLA
LREILLVQTRRVQPHKRVHFMSFRANGHEDDPFVSVLMKRSQETVSTYIWTSLRTTSERR